MVFAAVVGMALLTGCKGEQVETQTETAMPELQLQIEEAMPETQVQTEEIMSECRCRLMRQ